MARAENGRRRRRRGGHEDSTVGRPRCVGSGCAGYGGERLAGSWPTLNRASGSLPAGDRQGGGRDSPGEDGASGSGSGGRKRRPRRRKPGTGGGPPDPADGRSGDGLGAAVVVGTEAGDHGWGRTGGSRAPAGEKRASRFLGNVFWPNTTAQWEGGSASQQIWEALVINVLGCISD